MLRLLIFAAMLAATCSVYAVEPPVATFDGWPQVEVCRGCRPPGTWEPIQYPTPLRNFFFGRARFRPDPNFRWEPGRWVPREQPSPIEGVQP